MELEHDSRKRKAVRRLIHRLDCRLRKLDKDAAKITQKNKLEITFEYNPPQTEDVETYFKKVSSK
ncbi:MAG: hypothetical protein AMS27_01235 [Bacteroides sp. SM23_62_1]|nr:MAG: hypothetical protein AMS27_01235 [Bacteroides sp. SM23_62_1]